jgi:transcriptional regulator with XRE-family HTH domain
MSRLLESLRTVFDDEATRYDYVEAHLNASVSAQIRRFRRKMSQQELAEKIGTKQSGISRLESASYSSWKVETLRKLARAFGLRLTISFEEFGTLIPEIADFESKVLNKRPFSQDPVFNQAKRRPPSSELDFQIAHQQLKEIPAQITVSGYVTGSSVGRSGQIAKSSNPSDSLQSARFDPSRLMSEVTQKALDQEAA